MEIGKWNSLPHYSVVGKATDFYLYYNDGKSHWSNWIKGKDGFVVYNKLKKLYEKDKKGFLNLFKKEFDKNKK